MTGDRVRRALEIFNEVCDLAPDSRDSALAEHCGDDAELRARVEQMLASDAEDGGLVDEPRGAALLAQEFATDGGFSTPERIGSYRVVRKIGHGGMGVVYEAEQDRPRRRVALKLIRREYATREVLRRFEYESHVLGQLDHPGIAHIFEAGFVEMADASWPYFAMELVEGRPLDEHVESSRLTTAQTLELVARVCDAVQHAHQKGIVHRDIKPANILVKTAAAAGDSETGTGTGTTRSTVMDEIGQPKILDFGIARATGSDDRSTTLQTQAGQIVGTIAYMSPEQVEGRSADLDTRCDVYAIGIVLYELLAGRHPFELSDVPAAEAARIISEQDPPKLSTTRASLRGDVETIVGKAIDKDADRRYPSAGALAEDLRRFLHHEPIAARPPSTFYQLNRFARRNKALVGGVVVSFFLLIAGITGTGLSLREALRANSSLEEKNEQLQEVTDFQSVQLFRIDVPQMGKRIHSAILKAVPEGERDELRQRLGEVNFTNTAMEVLERDVLGPSLEAIDEQFEDQPAVRAQLLQSFATTAKNLGLSRQALAPMEKALEIRQRELGADHKDTLISMARIGTLLAELDRREEAEIFLRDALDGRRRVLGDDHIETLASMNNLGGFLLEDRESFDEATELYHQALEGRRKALGEDHPHTINSIHNLGYLMQRKGDPAGAEGHFRKAMEARKRIHGENAPETLASIANVAGACLEQGKHQEAGQLFERGLAVRRALFGDDHPDTLTALNNLGGLRVMSGDHKRAVECFEEVVERRLRVLGEAHKYTLDAFRSLIYAARKLQIWEKAEGWARQYLEIERRREPLSLSGVTSAISDLTTILLAQGRYAEAEALALEGLTLRRRQHPDGSWTTWITQSQLGEAIAADPERFSEAEQLLVEAAEKMKPPPRFRHFGQERLAAARARLVDLYETRHELEPDGGYAEKALKWKDPPASR